MSANKSKTLKARRTLTTIGNPWVEMGFDLHGLCSRITTHSEKEQCDMGYRGSNHEDGSLHSHEKHMDLRSAGLNLSKGDSSITWYIELYSVRLRYKVPIRISTETTRGVQDTVTLQYSFSPSHKWADWENYSNAGGYAASMSFRLQASLIWAASTDWVFLQQQLPCQHRDGPIRSVAWPTV